MKLVITDDEAWTEAEWQARERERKQRASAERRRLNRRWMRVYRGEDPRDVVASLHALRCTGPTRDTGCRCKKIPLYGEPE